MVADRPQAEPIADEHPAQPQYPAHRIAPLAPAPPQGSDHTQLPHSRHGRKQAGRGVVSFLLEIKGLRSRRRGRVGSGQTGGHKACEARGVVSPGPVRYSPSLPRPIVLRSSIANRVMLADPAATSTLFTVHETDEEGIAGARRADILVCGCGGLSSPPPSGIPTAPHGRLGSRPNQQTRKSALHDRRP